MITWINSFLSLLFPRYCAVCGNVLGKHNTFMCIKCDIDMPRTNLHLITDNRLEKLLWGRINNLQRAAGYFYYSKGSTYCDLIHEVKYNGNRELGEILGKSLTTEISDSGFFKSIDCIIPVPLHKKRYKERGYNQSEVIASGISKITGIPVVTDAIIRKKYTETQTRKSNFGRLENMEDAFEISPSYSHLDKHILLVDDIITTGATIAACGAVLQTKFPDIKISVLTIGFVPY